MWGMLIESLVQEFSAYFERDPQCRTILWSDPKRQWEGVLRYLRPHLPLLAYEGSLLQLPYQLIERSSDESAVVYLPFDKRELTRRGEAVRS